MAVETKPYITKTIKVKEGATPLFDVVEAQKEAIKRVRALPWEDHPGVVGGARAALSALMGAQSEEGHVENYINYVQLPITADGSVICLAVWKAERPYLYGGKIGVEIEHLFIFDKRSGKIADLRELWTSQPLFDGRNPEIISTVRRSAAWMIPTDPPTIDIKLSREFPDGWDSRVFEIIHELGHFWQLNTKYNPPVESYGDAIEKMGKMTTSGLGKTEELRFLFQLLFDRRSLVEDKTERIKMERNAHAFLLNLFRHLKHEGIDASESFPGMRRAIHEGLASYEHPVLMQVKSPSFEKRRRGRK